MASPKHYQIQDDPHHVFVAIPKHTCPRCGVLLDPAETARGGACDTCMESEPDTLRARILRAVDTALAQRDTAGAWEWTALLHEIEGGTLPAHALRAAIISHQLREHQLREMLEREES